MQRQPKDMAAKCWLFPVEASSSPTEGGPGRGRALCRGPGLNLDLFTHSYPTWSWQRDCFLWKSALFQRSPGSRTLYLFIDQKDNMGKFSVSLCSSSCTVGLKRSVCVGSVPCSVVLSENKLLNSRRTWKRSLFRLATFREKKHARHIVSMAYRERDTKNCFLLFPDSSSFSSYPSTGPSGEVPRGCAFVYLFILFIVFNTVKIWILCRHR